MTLHSESLCKSSSITSPPLSTPHTLMWLSSMSSIFPNLPTAFIQPSVHFLISYPLNSHAFTLHLKQLNAPNLDQTKVTKVRYTTFTLRGGRALPTHSGISAPKSFSVQNMLLQTTRYSVLFHSRVQTETLTRAIPPQPPQQQSGSMCFLLHIIFHHGLLIHGFSLTLASMKFVLSKAVTKTSGRVFWFSCFNPYDIVLHRKCI